MPGVREFLLRLRPAGTPGSAAAAGVPVDAHGRAGDELAPVFAALEPAIRDAKQIRQAGQEQAATLTTQVGEQVRVLLSQAQTQATVDRAKVAAEAIARADREAEAYVARAEQDVVKVRQEASARGDQLASAVVQRVRQLVSEVDIR